MDSKFTWPPLYEELAKALLRYKEDRTELVEWIYDDLGKVTGADGQSLVAYLKQKMGPRFLTLIRFQYSRYLTEIRVGAIEQNC